MTASPRAVDLVVVPSERHVERIARAGGRAETRASLAARLVAALLPDLAVCEARECRLLLGAVLARPSAQVAAPGPPRGRGSRGRSAGAAQMDLFGGAERERAPTPPAPDLLGPVRARGGASWTRTVFAIDDAIALLHASGASRDRVARVAERGAGVVAARARALADAMAALDDRLAGAGLVDARTVPARLTAAIRDAEPDVLVRAVGGRRIETRWLLAWDAADLAWWRALDERLAAASGYARVVLPAFDRPLDPTRERDPLEALTEDVARALDAPPEGEPVVAVLGDLAGGAPARVGDGRARVVRAKTAVEQANAVAGIVAAALARGAAVERVAVAAPRLDELTLAPLRRALDEAGVLVFEARGAPPSSSPVIAAALLALDVARAPERWTVARLLRSGTIDPLRLAAGAAGDDVAPRAAERAVADAARALETTPTAPGDDALARFVETVESATKDVLARSVARSLAAAFARAAGARTRRERIRAARSLFADLGIAARAGRGGLAAFARDEAPEGVARAERLAIARDTRAWEALVSTLDVAEAAAARGGALDEPVDADVFRLELTDVLDATASLPGAGRAAAVRVARLDDVAGDALDLLVVLDANEGSLPRDGSEDALANDALFAALAAVDGRFVAPSPSRTRDRDLAALAVAAADAEEIVLVHVREDDAGAPLAASFVVDVLERAGVPVEVARAEPVARPSGWAAARAAREREREAFFLDPARPRSDVVGDLAAGPEPPADAALAILTTETGGGDRPLAVTGLERFARCAFQGYAEVVLAAREIETREDVPDAREEGILLHAALAAAFTAAADLWARRPRPAEEILAAAAGAVERVLAAHRGHAPLRALARVRVREGVRAVLLDAVADEAWDFALAEQAFGMHARSGHAPWPAFDLEGEGDVALVLRGSIDRVDRAHDRSAARVIDYKRTKSTVRASAGGAGESAVQVPLYACVASRALGVPATGLYLAAQARDVAASKPTARMQAKMDELLAREGAALAPIERRVLAVVAGVREGRLAPLPVDEAVCRTCAVSGGCRKPRFAMTPAEDADDA